MARAVVTVPARAKRGEIVEVKTLAQHPMETGFRRTQLGELIRGFARAGNGAIVAGFQLAAAQHR